MGIGRDNLRDRSLVTFLGNGRIYQSSHLGNGRDDLRDWFSSLETYNFFTVGWRLLLLFWP